MSCWANIAAEVVRRVIPYDLFAILLYNEKRKDLRIRYAVGHREEVVQNLSLALGEGIVGTAAGRREPVLVKDVKADERYLSTSDIVRSELSVPMIARQRLVGVIDVQATGVDAFQDYDRAMLSLIAGRVAAAIDNAQLYRRAERQYRTIRTLSRVSNEFASILDIDELLSKVASSVRGLINYDAFSILLVDAAKQVLRHRFSIRFDQRINLDNISLGKGITQEPMRAASCAKSFASTTPPTDPRYIASHPGVRSEIAVLSDRARPRDRRAESRKRAHRLLHRGSRADVESAGPICVDRHRERAALPRDRRARAADAGGSQGGFRTSDRPVAQ